VTIEDATGGSGVDFIFGNAVENVINGGGGADTMSGGIGSDTYYVDNVRDKVNDHLMYRFTLPPGADSGVDTIYSSVSYSLTGTFAEKLVLLESGGATFAYGSSGRDTLVGNSFANILLGYQGDDSLTGGGGNDLYVDVTVGDNVNELINGGTDTVETAALVYALQPNIEILKSTLDLDPGQFGVEFFGNAIGNTIIGTAGADRLEGGAGDDKLYGLGGRDFFIGGAGADLIDGGFIGADTDTASYEGSVAGVTVALQGWRFDSGSIFISFLPVAAGSRGGDAAGDTLKSIENILGSNAGDTLVGDVFDNVLHGNGGRDYLAGAGGDDHLYGSDISKMAATDARDQLEGGTGDDTFYLVGSEDRVVEYAGQGTDTIRVQLWSSTGQLGGFVGYIMADGATAQVENLTYTGSFYNTFDGPDIVTDVYFGSFYGTGNSLNNVITGGSKDDVLIGLGGDDTLIGKQGADGLYGGLGNDLLIGGQGADGMNGDDGTDTISYADSNEAVTVALATGFFPVKVLGFDTFLAVRAGLRGGDAEGDTAVNIENILGSAGNDTLVGNAVSNYIFGDIGNDWINGGLGADLLVGGLGLDLILGAAGDDEIRGGQGADTMDGGDGVDTLSYAASAVGVTAAFENTVFGAGSLFALSVLAGFRGGDAQGDTAKNFENIIGSGLGDTLVGNLAANNLSGREGNDRISGKLGSDIIRGDGGNDVLNGDGGADNLDGGNGNDSLDGGIGVDIMNGGSSTANGNDSFVVDDLGDRVTDTASGDNDTVYSSVSFALTAGINKLVLTGVNAINGTASADNTTIIGNSAANIIAGGAGLDILNGGAGVDNINGGTGDDRIDGGTGADIMYGGGSTAINVGHDIFYVDNIGDKVIDVVLNDDDSVLSTVSFVLSTGVDRLYLQEGGNLNGTGNAQTNFIGGNTGANTLDGMAGNDFLWGGAGGDNLLGGLGNDRLTGEAGNDILTGGLGLDTFNFNSALNGLTNVDTITDFNAADDTIRLMQDIFPALPKVLFESELPAGFFKANATGKATDFNDHIIYNTTTGALSYDSNGSKIGGDVAFAVLTGRPTITYHDFIFDTLM
jgi:Ca2+-binding RTX toxin-like protein